MSEAPEALTRPAAEKPTGWLDDAILAVACWYLTGLVAFLGFAFGYDFVIPTSTVAARDLGFVGVLGKGGGDWYRQIAEDGYGHEPRRHLRAAFFPVYPLLGRAVRGATGLSTEAALLMVSNVSMLAFLFMLARYVRARFDDSSPALAGWTLVAAGLFPTGCFFRMCYTESTFLLIVVAVMYGIHRRWPLPAVVFLIGLATATRATGVALLAPLAIHIWRNHPARSARAWRLAVWLPLACWGLVAFVVFQHAILGDAFATAHAQSIWRVRPAAGPSEKLAALATLEPFRTVYDRFSPAYWAARDAHGTAWFNLYFANPIYFAAAAALTAIGIVRRWVTLGESMLVALLLLIPYVTRAHENGMAGMGRFTAVAFPVYIVLAQIFTRLPAPVATALLSISAFFLAAYSALFVAGYMIA